MRNKKYVLLNIFYGIVLFFFVISLSISLPILCRFIHTLCIKPMNIVENLNSFTGQNYTYEDVVEAYNEVLNYCVFYTKFGAGKLLYPEEDVLHFEDCRVLFTIDLAVLLVTTILIIVFKIIEKKKRTIMLKPLTYLLTGVLTIILPLVLVLLCSRDFNAAFIKFHELFFPGKDNYWFNPNVNYIVLILPEDFFMVCAIVIAVGVFLGATILIICWYLKRRKVLLLKKRDIYENI